MTTDTPTPFWQFVADAWALSMRIDSTASPTLTAKVYDALLDAYSRGYTDAIDFALKVQRTASMGRLAEQQKGDGQ